MRFIPDAIRKIKRLASPRSFHIGILSLLFVLMPGFASAAEGNVVLNFSNSDKIYLYVSLALGAIALITAFMLRSGVMAMSPGDEKMQEVGHAIKEGALAYLRQQVKTMSIFVLVLAVVLFFLYKSTYDSAALGGGIAISFILGVAASYIAGYTGMLMAVEGNMRTANAALTSYAKTLQVAFRSGAVAGMVTVGMGLVGATLIFLFASADAMKLLVGFGFGGSLAALFMRVGGGIFTKAADVGADLVGKVEAGIPEDDPRNPATIADNVGDNVGDCAGMAADVFESYEVTLVAAIILGAATASIFDTNTWMKLILFALMARGVGIVASILGIYMVKGSDDLDSDPLAQIRRGFTMSAVTALVGTGILAYFMMGGTGPKVQTSRLVNTQAIFVQRVKDALALRQKVALEKNKPVFNVTAEDLKDRPDFKALGNSMMQSQLLQAAFMPNIEDQLDSGQFKEFEGYHRVDIDTATQYTVKHTPAAGGTPQYLTLKEALKNLQAVHIQRTTPPSASDPNSGTLDLYLVTTDIDGIKKQLDQAPAPKPTIAGTLPVAVFANEKGDLAFGVPGKPDDMLGINAQITDSIYNVPKETITKADEQTDAMSKELQAISTEAQDLQTKASKATGAEKTKLESDAAAKNIQAQALQKQMGSISRPDPVKTKAGALDNQTVPWWTFLAAIGFGVLMAFAIEKLTDYYVSTHKKPVREVAGVSTAGPAPMIIQGFALAAESSVFSVLAIVIALIAPLVIFPPQQYGGYILSFYGIALVGLGLLTTTGFILAMDTFGPISDNAQGVFEMSGAGHTSETGSKAVQRLDAAGNTTKALTKGFAIATAVVAAVALFHSYVEDAHLTVVGMRLEVPEIFLGLLIGAAAPYLFAAFSINAVGRAAFQLINEVRTQFRNDPGIMAGTSKPNYGSCVAIVTAAAQKELLGPAILAIFLPVAVAFGFSIGKPHTMVGDMEVNLVGAEALGGFLAGAILSGQLLAVLLANSGGIWDNAKKLIEDGMYGGKGTEAHKAGVVCDTVGDPFKDTAGPAMNPLIKVMNLVGLLMAPLIIKPFGDGILIGVTLFCVVILAFSIWWSKRGSMSSAMSEAAAEANAVAAAAAHELPTSSVPIPGTRRITVDDEEESPS